MHQIDVSTAASTLPASTAPGVPGYFTDGDLIAGVAPTIVPAEFLNALMLELLGVLAGAGISPSKSQHGQLLLAIESLIESRSGSYALDTGAAGAYVVALDPPVAVYTTGLQVRFRAAHANAGPCTLNAGGGAVPLCRDDGSPLQQGDIPSGIIVTAVYDKPANVFLLNSLVPSQFGSVAKENIGLGLEDDGAGSLRVKLTDNSLRRTASGVQTNDPIATVAANTSVLAASHGSTVLVTGAAVTLTAPASAGLWNGYNVTVIAKGGPVTFTVNAADKVNGGAAGGGYTILQGQSVNLVTDGAGNWWPIYQTGVSIPGNFSPLYVATSQTLGAGTYDVDTTAGPITITLPAGIAAGTTMEFSDVYGTWGTNNLTLARNGNTIEGSATNFICNMSGTTVQLIFNGSDWRLR